MRTVAIALLLCFGLWLPCQALAGKRIRIETEASETPNGKPAAALVINDATVAQLAKPQRGRSPLSCVSVAAALIAQAYRSGQADFHIESSDDTGRRYALYLNGRVLLVATDEEGKAWGAEPEQLAQTWRDNITRAISMPPLEQDGEAVDAPSRPAAPATQAQPPPAASGAVLDVPAAGGPASHGIEGLVVTSGHRVYVPPASLSVGSSVALPQSTAVVTGSAPGAESLHRSIEAALRAQLGLSPGASLAWELADPPAGGLKVAPGAKLPLKVHYALAGEDLAKGGHQAQVALENRSLSIPRESLTFFSNSPEAVAKPQLLYHAELPGRQAARLVLHHQNQCLQVLYMVVRVLNSGSAAGAVHIVPGSCEPDINTFYVGFKSGEAFWMNLNSGNGYVVNVPAGGQAVVMSQRLAPGFTASGYFKLTNLGDSPLRVETIAASVPALSNTPMPDTPGASCGVFPAPYQLFNAVYQTGGDWLYLRLGKESPASLVDDSHHNGCYGVTYSFDIELRNDKPQPALVFVVLRASGGEVKGQFFIDDQYMATPLIAGGEEQLLKEIPLKPNETKLLKIRGIPLNGGFYPASIILRESRYP
jgi:hypothetical protein